MSLIPRYCKTCGRKSNSRLHDCDAVATEDREWAEVKKKVDAAAPDFTRRDLEILATHEDGKIAKKAREALDREGEARAALEAYAKRKQLTE